jgi:hypothetical protein
VSLAAVDRQVIEELRALGIDTDGVDRTLEDEAVRAAPHPDTRS